MAISSGKWKLEIERKFLLKAMPDKIADEVITIDQYYWKNKSNIWERARTYHSDKSGDSYIHTNSKFINKERHIYKQGDLKWEVDRFDNGYKLIIAELEIPKKTYKIVMPNYIMEVFLLEVTGLKQFSNRNLSINIQDINKFQNRI